jgi:hypothetical protein
MTELERDLRATAEDVAADATRIQEIEEAKARLDPSDPRVAELSAESEQLAERLVPKTVAERELADAAKAADRS